ncbi:hypothetical protein SUGI_0449950 [Cryptomeria japonica]|nr:hypothetical protein SUGI_0449950 [Cryptomeria japonica]
MVFGPATHEIIKNISLKDIALQCVKGRIFAVEEYMELLYSTAGCPTESYILQTLLQIKETMTDKGTVLYSVEMGLSPEALTTIPQACQGKINHLPLKSV